MTNGTGNQAGRRLQGLLVDDEESFSIDASKMIEDRLKKRGVMISMQSFSHPEHAVEAIEEMPPDQPYDLVMTDMLFPPVGRPDAPPAEHTQRGSDVMSAAKTTGVPVVLAFTLHGAKRFQELRFKCKTLGVKLYQRDDLIAAEEESVIDEIADMLRALSDSENRRKKTVCLAGASRDAVWQSMAGFLSALEITPIQFEERVPQIEGGSLPTVQEFKMILEEVQAFIVVLAPELRVLASTASAEHEASEQEVGYEPNPRVYLSAGMAHAIDSSRLIIVRIGNIRRSCILYPHSIKLDGTLRAQNAFIARLVNVGCRVGGSASGGGAAFAKGLAEGS